MDARKIVGLILLAAGVLLLALRGIPYTEKHKADLGPLSVSVKEQRRMPVPVWLGAGLAIVGGVLLVLPSRR